jgi:hypothetical protein
MISNVTNVRKLQNMIVQLAASTPPLIHFEPIIFDFVKIFINVHWCVRVYSLLITLEYMYRLSWNSVCIPCHLWPPQRRTSYNPPISNTNITASDNVEVITLISLQCLKRSSWKVVRASCHIYILHNFLPLVIPTLQPLKYNVLLPPLRINTEDFFYLSQ